jgi:hypothetical protein
MENAKNATKKQELSLFRIGHVDDVNLDKIGLALNS